MLRKFVIAILASVMAGTTQAGAEVANLSCDQTGPTEYKLSFSLTGGSHEVRIFVSTDPSGPNNTDPILKTSEMTVTVHAGAPGQRIYFFLKPDHGGQREVSIRHLPLEGTPNFRDLGGYETTDGHFVRWGVIYRSGVLSYLTPKDFAYLSQLGIRVVCDFRTAEENAKAPEIWVPDARVEHISLPIGSGTSKGVTTSFQEILAANPGPTEFRAWMIKNYGAFAFTNAPEYSKVLVQLEQDHLPLLYHCSAGKDRTGLFSAFLLIMLGVPENTAVEDYALTNKYLLDASQRDFNRKMLANANPAYAKVSPELKQIMMAADPEYVKSTLRQIEAHYGSFDNYRRTELGVTDHDLDTLRSRLLTK